MNKEENFILAFQIDNDKLLDGLIDYHKNKNEYKYKSEEVTHSAESKSSTDVTIYNSSTNELVKTYINYHR